METGTFIISLDFELYWGLRDQMPLVSYKDNLLGVRRAIPAMLDLFSKFDIHATWATVGFLHFGDKNELMQSLPHERPAYTRAELSPYPHNELIGSDESCDPFHYGASLLELIRACPYQEIGSHTFCHYYCLEEGQNADAFKADLEASVNITYKKTGNIPRSIVFPRNQVNPDYLSMCAESGILAYRGNARHWAYTAEKGRSTRLKRIWRLLDAYLNLTGHHTYKLTEPRCSPFDLPASRFLRPYSNLLRLLEPLKINRIKADLTYAAKANTVYHLWWHPHNFGGDVKNNIEGLNEILTHYLYLKREYGFKSLNMGEAASTQGL